MPMYQCPETKPTNKTHIVTLDSRLNTESSKQPGKLARNKLVAAMQRQVSSLVSPAKGTQAINVPLEQQKVGM